MDRINQIKDNLAAGYNCSQAIFAAFAEAYGIPRDTALKLSMNLGGGCVFRGEICGAVSAALLIYGLHFGSERVNDELSEEIVYHLSSEHIKEFREKYGSILCRELLGKDIGNPDEFANLMADGLFRLKCSGFILNSAEILIRKIEETE